MPIVRLPEGDLRDEVRQPLYDTIVLGAGVSISGLVTKFFANVQGKPLSQTNLKQNNLLETAVSFRLQGMSLDAQNFRFANQYVIPLLLERASLVLKIGEKDYWRGPTRFAAGRLVQSASGATDILAQQYGWSAVQGVNLGSKHTVDINPLQAFDVTMSVDVLSAGEAAEGTPAAGTQIPVVCSLKGLLRRPVQ